MPFVADVKTFDGRILFKDARVVEIMGPQGNLLYVGINVSDKDTDSVDEMDFILLPNSPVYFELKAPKV